MKFNARLILLSIIALLFIASCEDDPSSVGSDLIRDDFGDDVIVLKEFDTYLNPLTTITETLFSGSEEDTITYGASSRLILGELNGIRSDLLIRFKISLPDSVVYALDDDLFSIVSTKIRMYPEYDAGDPNTDLTFGTYLISEKWGTDFTKDSLQTLSYEPNDITKNYDFQDSVITFDIDNDIVLNWYHDYADTVDFPNNGLLFSPLSNNRALGFYAVDENDLTASIALETVYRIDSGNLDTLRSFVAWDVHVLNFDRNETVLEPDEIMVQGGYNVRSNLEFDFSVLPQNIAINQAILELKLKEGTDKSVYAHDAVDSLVVIPYSNAAKDSLFSIIGRLSRSSDDENLFSGDISNLLQYIINKDKNFGFKIELEDEQASIARFILMNEKATNLEDRPRLKISYTSKN